MKVRVGPEYPLACQVCGENVATLDSDLGDTIYSALVEPCGHQYRADPDEVQRLVASYELRRRPWWKRLVRRVWRP